MCRWGNRWRALAGHALHFHLVYRSLTIHGKHIFNLFLKDSQGSLNAVGFGHGVDIIAVKPLQIQNLKCKTGHRQRITTKPNSTSPLPNHNLCHLVYNDGTQSLQGKPVCSLFKKAGQES